MPVPALRGKATISGRVFVRAEVRSTRGKRVSGRVWRLPTSVLLVLVITGGPGHRTTPHPVMPPWLATAPCRCPPRCIVIIPITSSTQIQFCCRKLIIARSSSQPIAPSLLGSFPLPEPHDERCS